MDSVTENELVRGKRWDVLDKGHVILLDWMGDDQRITDSARLSYGVTKEAFEEADIKLLRMLMRHKHWSPFENVSLYFRVKAPIFVARQWFRHRTGKYNEISGRYTEMKDDCYVPETSRLQMQAKDNKQGSAFEEIEDAEYYRDSIREEQDDIFDRYTEYLHTGMAKELARINLPLSTYTEFTFKCDLRNMFNFAALRLDSHAQYEIRVYAEAMYEAMKLVAPHACKAFEDYQLNSLTFSGPEVRVLQDLLSGMVANDVAQTIMLAALAKSGATKREVGEFQDKLGIIGL